MRGTPWLLTKARWASPLSFEHLAALKERHLGGVDPAARFGEGEPLGVVDLGELANDARARGPLERERSYPRPGSRLVGPRLAWPGGPAFRPMSKAAVPPIMAHRCMLDSSSEILQQNGRRSSGPCRSGRGWVRNSGLSRVRRSPRSANPGVLQGETAAGRPDPRLPVTTSSRGFPWILGQRPPLWPKRRVPGDP